MRPEDLTHAAMCLGARLLTTPPRAVAIADVGRARAASMRTWISPSALWPVCKSLVMGEGAPCPMPRGVLRADRKRRSAPVFENLARTSATVGSLARPLGLGDEGERKP